MQNSEHKNLYNINSKKVNIGSLRDYNQRSTNKCLSLK